jgi:PPIC-type PPIASE domain
MAWQRRWLGAGVIGLSGLLLTGCARDLPPFAIPDHSFAADISETSARPQVRSQVGDGPLGTPQQIAPPSKFSVFPIEPLDKPAGFMKETKTPAVLVPPPPGLIQTSLSSNRGTVRVQVRAWVNGRPIFQDELAQGAGPDMNRIIKSVPPSQQSEEVAKLLNAVLEQIIDQEVMYQDAVKKLEKINPPALVKMKDYVDHEFQKTLKRMRDANVPEDQIREMEPTARRMMERNLISTEYARSRIMDVTKSRVNLDSIREYYEAHKNEFRTVDKVVWQDIFIPVDKNLPTIEQVRRFAEEEINKCRTPGDFDKLMVYNQGDSKLRGGEGLGTRLSAKVVPADGKSDFRTVAKGEETVAGDIRPAELEPYLAKLREGEIGPVVAFPMGVHLIRVTKREYAGQMPLDENVQKAISKKLEGQIADREYRRIVRELRLRSVIQVERETP